MVLSTNNAGKAGPSQHNTQQNHQGSQKGMKNHNSSSGGLQNNTASGKNMRSMSLSKRLAMAGAPQQVGNNTIDLHKF